MQVQPIVENPHAIIKKDALVSQAGEMRNLQA